MVAHSQGRNALFGGSQLKERVRLLKAGAPNLSLVLKERKGAKKDTLRFLTRGRILDVDSKYWKCDEYEGVGW